jgi:hypothetical protein
MDGWNADRKAREFGAGDCDRTPVDLALTIGEYKPFLIAPSLTHLTTGNNNTLAWSGPDNRGPRGLQLDVRQASEAGRMNILRGYPRGGHRGGDKTPAGEVLNKYHSWSGP